MKSAEDVYGIDALADLFLNDEDHVEKQANYWWEKIWSAPLGHDNWQALKGGVLTAALLAGGGTGVATYNWAKKRNQQKLLQKALQIRARQRQQVPPPQYVTLEDDKEDELNYAA